MAAQQGSVGHNHAAADVTIVGDMAAGHDERVAAERRYAVFFFGAAIDGDSLADDVLVAHYGLGVGAAVANVLWLTAQDSARKDSIVLADRNPTHNRHVIQQVRSATNPRLGTNHAERTDADIFVQLG